MSDSSHPTPDDPGPPRWIGPENDWGVPLLDVRPVTFRMMAVSADPKCAENAVSYGNEDGRVFLDQETPEGTVTPVSLEYPTDPFLADGVLFSPRQMEHKWALFLHRDRILCVRSWLRRVVAIAEIVRTTGGFAVTSITGSFAHGPSEVPVERILDFLLRSHVLRETHPAPLPDRLASTPQDAALWCMSMFGNMGAIATHLPFEARPPERPVRTDSLLHIATARGDLTEIDQLLSKGVPFDILSQGGLTPLHWAAALESADTVIGLLERGCPVDLRSAEGATPLVNAVQSGNLVTVTTLLDRGADPDAGDARGFTALHRAAEMGRLEIARLLLERGAHAHPEALGHTPRSLAADRGEEALVALLDRHP